MANQKSCAWCTGDALLKTYHDTQWGIHQLHDDDTHFEFLTLEAMQCGLSWMTVLKKRDAMREAFDGFALDRIALYDDGKIESLMAFPGALFCAYSRNAAHSTNGSGNSPPAAR